MSGTQNIIYGLIILLLAFSIRRFLLFRSVRQYSPAEAAARMSNGKGVILPDVRTAAERSDRLIQGSVHIPLHELPRRIGELEKYRDSEIICYCRSGNRSLNAAATLRKHGFRAANLQGGMIQWNYSGHR